MKMWPLIYSTVFIYAVFIIEAASGQTVNKIGVIGGTVSFGPASLTPPVSSIVWKQSSGGIVKAIEWDGDEPDVGKKISVPNPRFQNITTLDEKTGNITIANLNAGHAGTYILEINSKEQAQRFKLEVFPPVPKPEIIIERINSDTVYLECRYNDTIIWKNSTGDIQISAPTQHKGKSITVEKKENPENFYTCTLKNAASESTSDPVYKRDLFKPSSDSGHWWIALIVIPLILIPIFVLLYKYCKSFRDVVFKNLGRKPCIGGILNFLDGKKNTDGKEQTGEKAEQGDGLLNSVDGNKNNGKEQTGVEAVQGDDGKKQTGEEAVQGDDQDQDPAQVPQKKNIMKVQRHENVEVIRM